MIKHILIPIDGSENANRALDNAKTLAKKYESKVTLVNVYKIPKAYIIDEKTHSSLKQLEEELIAKSSEILSKAEDVLKKDGINVKTISLKSLKDNPGYSIEYSVNKEKCDLIVVGNRGYGSIKGALIGSVSRYLIHNCNCPVLVVK